MRGVAITGPAVPVGSVCGDGVDVFTLAGGVLFPPVPDGLRESRVPGNVACSYYRDRRARSDEQPASRYSRLFGSGFGLADDAGCSRNRNGYSRRGSVE